MKKLFSSLLVLALVSTVFVACKKGEEQKIEGNSSVQSVAPDVVTQEQAAPASDVVTTPSDTPTQPAEVSTTQPSDQQKQ